jgi:Ca-activated chloride channel family protein
MFHDWAFREPFWLAWIPVAILLGLLRFRRPASAWVIPYATSWQVPLASNYQDWASRCVILGLVLMGIAMARPQKIHDKRESHRDGYDLVLALDLSGSMLAEDYGSKSGRMNRLQALRPIIEAFIARRPSDRIGIVVFAGRAYTLAPLTFDHAWLRSQTARLQAGLLDDGTAIGDGLGIALGRLQQRRFQDEARRLGAFVILMTDGANNVGKLLPLDVADIARSKGIPIYTIGAGREGIVPMPVFDQQGNKAGYRPWQSDLDEATLQEIAKRTGAEYFRAADTDTIARAFDAIDSRQRVQFEAKTLVVATEFFPWFAVPGLISCLFGVWLSRTSLGPVSV